MLFNSLVFAIFFAIVLIVYNALGKYYKLQNRFLLIASYVFYGWWSWILLSLLTFSITLDYVVAKLVYKEDHPARKKAFLAVSVMSNLGILGFFKYFNFFYHSLVALLQGLGLNFNYSTLQIILPVGISFYTFQSMSYVVDVYRGRLKPADNIMDYALFVSFFPQLVAGPILRAGYLLPQFLKPRTVTLHDYNFGIWLIIWGLFKKIVIADNCALVVDRVFAEGALVGGGDILIAVLLFTFQIYCDFSGYSDIAIGLGRLMGFRMGLNFNLPYFSRSVQEFWKRWHISLSSWLKDYLYIPLGGNRQGRLHTYKNLLLTMLLGGLWHGASWTFVIWGGFHGLALVFERVFHGKINLLKPVGIAITFIVVSFSWLIFRARSFSHLTELTAAVSRGFSVKQAYPGINELWFYILFLFVFQLVQYRKRDLYFITRAVTGVKVFFYSLVVIFTVFSGNFGAHQFIYFQF